jgi:hypothetical protein
VFTGEKGALTSGFKAWMKPPGCKWIYILAVGAGGGGGRTSSAQTTTVGGGGGGSGSITRALFPAQMFPDIIYVRPGTGGVGATAQNTAGGTGFNSYISIAPDITAQNVIFIFSPGGGGSASTTGGTGGAITVASSGIWINAGIFTSVAGQAGSAGASLANTSGANVTYTGTGLFVSGGAGGGNGTGAGGDITGSGPMPTISGGVGGGGGNAGRGRPGFNDGLLISPGLRTFPMLFSGGSGGGGGSSGNDGQFGGAGAYGSGGGGGGATRAESAASGNGGDGGDALIMIGAF